MNDYLLERYSKHDIREFWSSLLAQKKEWQQGLEQAGSDESRSFLEGSIHAISLCMEKTEKSFDLF